MVLASASALAAAGEEAPGPGARWFIVGLGLVLVVLGAWLGRVFVLPKPIGVELPWPGRFRRAIGAMAVAFGLFLAIGGAGETLHHGDWETSYERGVATAKESGKPIIVDAWATWCKACLEIYDKTLTAPDVEERLSGYVKIKLDMDEEINLPLEQKFGGGNLPYVAVYADAAALAADPARPSVELREFVPPEEFLERLEGKAPDDKVSIAQWLAERGLFVTLLLVFLGGIAVSFTPCVVPVYILTVNVIGTRRTESLWGRLGLSSVYVLGLALTYTVLGVVAGLTSASMGVAFQHPAVVGSIAGLFILMALFYLEIFRLPQAGSLASKITASEKSNVLTAFLLGTAAGLIAAPCVGPLLIGILAYISSQQDAWLGFWLMFTFAIGMGLLFIAIGTFTGVLEKVRKVGGWGYRLEMLFAVAFLAVGVYYLRQVLPPLGALFPWLAGISPV